MPAVRVPVTLPPPSAAQVRSAIPWNPPSGLVWVAESSSGVPGLSAYGSAPKETIFVGSHNVTYVYLGATFANLATVIAYVIGPTNPLNGAPSGPVYVFSARQQPVVRGFGLPQVSPLPIAIRQLNPAQVQAAVLAGIPWAPPAGARWAVPPPGPVYASPGGGPSPLATKTVNVEGVGTVTYTLQVDGRGVGASISGSVLFFVAEQLRVNSPRGLPQS